MNRKTVFLTIINLLVCFTALNWRLGFKEHVLAQGQPQAFLGPIYYGQTSVTSIFDHDRPLKNEDDGNNFVLHYDNQPYAPPIPVGYRYDQHEGIDYALSYRIVLAAADGTVDEAGWAVTDNHTQGLGLRVIIEHDNDYSTYYGHLSSIAVRRNEAVTVVPANREGIIGVSGNTGNSTGDHLHFELRNEDDNRVNPYGWIGPAGADAWEIDSGATSYDLWIEYPSISTMQFPTDDAVDAPPLTDARVTMDNTHDFAAGSCFTLESNNDGYNDSYVWYASGSGTGSLNCTARWTVPTDSYTPPGDYHIYAYVPASATAYFAHYRIYHNNTSNAGYMVQADYPNGSHDEWVYLGRREFAMDGNETILLRSEEIDSDPGGRLVADAVRLVPAFTPAIAGTIYVSTNSNGTVTNGSLTYSDEDILRYNSQSDSWEIYFDGGDVFLTPVDVDAFHLLANGEILMSVESPIAIAGLGTVDDSDIVRFIPTSLGETTNGSFVMHKTAADLGLNPANEKMDIDAIGLTPEGKLIFSIADQVNLPGFSYKDQDLILFEDGVGTSMYFDGSDVGLTGGGENLTGTWVDSETGNIYLSTECTFNVPGSDGDGADAFICSPISTGTNTDCTFGPGLFWNGGAHHFANAEMDGLSVNLSEVVADLTVPISQGSDDAGPYGASLGITICSATEPAYAVDHNEIYFGDCPDGTPMVSGMRFAGVSIPQGADTQSPLTQATVPWLIPVSEPWVSGEIRYSPDLTSIIQEIVNQSGWQSGNAITLIVEPVPAGMTNYNRRVFAWDRYDNSLEAPKLQIWYSVP